LKDTGILKISGKYFWVYQRGTGGITGYFKGYGHHFNP
jgi:hypothetical protein